MTPAKLSVNEQGRLILEDREHLAARIQREAAASRTGAGGVAEELIADRRAETAREDEDRLS